MASGQRFFTFNKDGVTMVHDRSNGIYYRQDTGEVYDPITGKWQRPPGQDKPSKGDPFTQLGTMALGAGTSAYAQKGGEWLADNGISAGIDKLGGLFGLGGGTSGIGPVASGSEYATALSGGAPVAGSSAGGMFGLGGIGSAGNVILPAAGAVGAYDLINNWGDYSAGRGGLQGAASGAAIGSYFGPWGAAIGGGIGGLAGLAGDLFNHTPNTRKEEARMRELEAQGQIIPEWWRNTMNSDIKDPHAGYRDDLGSDFVGMADDGTWVNNKFAMSRDVKDLQGTDIAGYAAFPEKFGNEWHFANTDTQKAIADEALRRGAVSEHHGTIDIQWTPELEKFAQERIKDPKNRRKG